MPDVEYILRIVLRARDEMAAVLAKARTELRGFSKDAQGLDTVLGKLNGNIDKFNANLDGVLDRLKEWQATMRDAGGETDGLNTNVKESVKNLDDLSNKMVDNSKAAAKQKADVQELSNQLGVLKTTQQELSKEFDEGKLSAEDFVNELNRIATAAKSFGSKTDIGSKLSSQFGQLSREAKREADDILDIDRSRITEQARLAKFKADADLAQMRSDEKAATDHAKALQKIEDDLANDLGKSLDKVISSRSADIDKMSAEIERAMQADELRRVGSAASAEATRHTTNVGDDAAATKAARDQAEAEADLGDRALIALEKHSKLRDEIDKGTVSDSDAASTLRRLSKEFDSISGQFEIGSREALDYAREAERARTAVRDLGDENEHTSSTLSSVADRLRATGDNVATLDNRVRGILLLAVTAFAQQVLTAVVALGGELVNLAGSAAMAGGALGGAFVAGLAQALPVIGLLIGAASRVQAVFAAFQQNQKLQQAQATDADKTGQKALDQSKALGSATDQVTSATERLADARTALNKANSDGARQLVDLIFQEKQAALAAKGASLDVKTAQQALQAAVTGGASALEIQQRQQSLDEARLNQPRSQVLSKRATQDANAPGGNVNNLQSVKDAQRQVTDAQRALDSANRGLDDAEDKTERAASSTMTAAANLKYLLSQLSPAERDLYKTLNTVYDDYKKIFIGDKKTNGIYGVIIESFTGALDEVDKLLNNNDVIKTVRTLAGSVADAIDQIVGAISDPTTLGQFEKITGEASDNLGDVTTDVINLGKAFTNIAVAAGPALSNLFDYIGGIVDKFLGVTDNPKKLEDFFTSGEKHLESWGNLALAVVNLFAALVGESADDGKQSIDELTGKINDATTDIQKNGDKVRKFFDDAKSGAEAIGGVVVGLGKEILASFNPDSLQKFADFVQKAVIPAVGGVIRGIGKVADLLATIADNPIGAFAAKWAIIGLISAQLTTSLFGAVGYFGKIFTHFKDLGGALTEAATGVKNIGPALKDFGAAQQDAAALAEGGAGKLTLWGKVLAGLGPIATTAGTEIEAAAAIAFGPWGILIAAVVAAIALLLIHFGQVDDIVNSVKDSFKQFEEELTPVFKQLSDALDGIGVKANSTKDVFDFLNKVGHALAVLFREIIDIGVGAFFDNLAAGIIIIIGVIQAAINLFHGLADILIGIFTLDPKQILGGLREIVTGFKNLATDIVRGLELGFKAIVKIMLGPFEAAWAAIKDFFGIKSPSKLAQELGTDIVNGLVNGLKAAGKAILAAGSWIWGRIKEGVGDTVKFGEKIVDDIVEGFKKLPDVLSDAVHEMGKDLEDIGKRIAEALWEGIKKGPGAVAGLVSKASGKIGDILGFAHGGPVGGTGSGDSVIAKLTPGEHVITKDEVARAGGHSAIFALRALLGGGGQARGLAFADGGAVAGAAGLTVTFDGNNMDGFSQDWKKFWGDIETTTRQGSNYVEDQFRDMRVNTSNSVDRMYRDIRGSIADIQNSFASRGSDLVTNWDQTWEQLAKVTYDGLNYIGHEANRALHGFGADTINFGLSAPAADQKAGGGWIGNRGERGRDKILTWLGRGEVVLNAAQQFAADMSMSGRNSLNNIVGNVTGFHAGGPKTAPGFAKGKASGESHLNRLLTAIDHVNSADFPYVLGGGHEQPASFEPFDCSGFVSYATQQAGYKVPTSTSGNIGDWGFPKGKGPVTIYYNPVHTFMGVGNKFAGTSGFARPNGGAGWFDQTPNPGYLSGFDTVHLPGINDVGAFSTVLGGQLAKLLVKGPNSGLRTGLQKMFNSVVGAGNSFLDAASSKASAGSGQWGDIKAGSIPAGAANIFKFFAQHGFNDNQAAAWVGNLTQESTLRPGAIQPNGEGHGLAQWGGSRFAALQSFAKKNGNGDWRDLTTQLNFILYELAGPENAASRAIHAAGSLQAAVDAIGLDYERYGIRGNRNAPAEAALRQFGGKFDQGGVIPGQLGKAVDIIAHAGEWVLNPGQQARLAQMVGLTTKGLKSILGFSGSNAKGFAGGGQIDSTNLGAFAGVNRNAAAQRSLDRGLADYDAMLDDIIKTWDTVSKTATARKSKGAKADKINDQFQKAIDAIDSIVGDDGVISRMSDAIQAQFDRAGVKLKAATLKVAGGIVTSRLGAVDVANQQLADLVANYNDLLGERGTIHDAIDGVDKQLRAVANDKSLSKSQKTKLTQQLNAQRVTLTKSLDAVDSSIADALQARLDAQIAAQQAAVDQITSVHDTAGKNLDIVKRVATALGNTDALSAVNQSIATNLAAEANELEGRIGAARAAGATDLADQLTAQVADLRTQVFEAAQQAIKDSVDAINKAATRRLGTLDLFGRMATALGVVSNTVGVNVGGEVLSQSQVFSQRDSALRQQQSGLQGALGVAINQGNQGLVQDLTDQLAELDVTIQENTKAAFQSKIDEVNNRDDFSTSINDLQKQLIDATDAVDGNTNTAALLKNAQDKQAILTNRGNDLQNLYNEAVSRGDVAAQQDLQKAILTNQVALEQNTLAINTLNGQGATPQTFSSLAWQWFRAAFFNGIGSVLPQYTVPGNLMSGASMAPVNGTTAYSTTANSGNTFNNTFTINEAGQPIDDTHLAGVVTWSQATAT